MFYNNLCTLCVSKNISVAKVMHDLGFSSGTATRWKQGTAQPSYKTLQKIADYFGVSVDELLSDNAADTKEKTADVKDINGQEEAERRQLIKTVAELASSMPTDKLRRLIKILKDE